MSCWFNIAHGATHAVEHVDALYIHAYPLAGEAPADPRVAVQPEPVRERAGHPEVTSRSGGGPIDDLGRLRPLARAQDEPRATGQDRVDDAHGLRREHRAAGGPAARPPSNAYRRLLPGRLRPDLVGQGGDSTIIPSECKRPETGQQRHARERGLSHEQ